MYVVIDYVKLKILTFNSVFQTLCRNDVERYTIAFLKCN